MPAAHLFVADLEHPSIDDVDRHHVERVLRLRPGEAVSVSDGAGGRRDCAYREGGELEPAGDVERQGAPVPRLTIGFALVKSDRAGWIVQKLTECGIDRILPFVADRSVVRWDPEKAGRTTERWRRIAREAAMQSRRTWLPTVGDVVAYSAIDRPVVIADIDADEPPTLGSPTVLVGPEGGWSPEERAAADRRIRLGPHVLRAETAAVAAGVLYAALRENIVDAAQQGD